MYRRQVYRQHNVQSFSHDTDFSTAAIELILPTYDECLGLEDKICRNWTLNPHPMLIPAVEPGWVESVYCFDTELGMERYVAVCPDVFFADRDGSLRSNRILYQFAGQYAVDLLIGVTLQVDGDGHSSTVTRGRLTSFGGMLNMGHDPRGHRCTAPVWLDTTEPVTTLERGKELAVQMVETFQKDGKPTFVDTLDTVAVVKRSGMSLAPVMIYGDSVTYLLTEDDIAYLYKAHLLDERRAMIAAAVGITSIGPRHDPSKTEQMCRDGLIALSEDLNVRHSDASHGLLVTESIADLVEQSGGLYDPPAHFRSW